MNKTYNPKEFEENIYNCWLENGYFDAEANPKRQPFTILMPPPNITGQLHIGHALDLTIQDAIIRYKRMCGFEALYMPGTDHASIATEVKIVEKMQAEGITKHQIGREEFLRRAFLWNDEFGGRIVNQQKRLGLSCDWRRSAFTMDATRSAAVKEVFVKMYDEGLIYQGDRIINWCPCCKTALSDAEVEYKESDSHLWHIRYPFEDGSGEIIIATTRPETMLGDVAVAVSPKDERYKKLVGKMLVLPLLSKKIPLIADNYVEMGFGTGAVKITPAHDPNDFEVGKRHDLPFVCVMDESAVMNENAGEFCGLTAIEARVKVVNALKTQGFLVKTEDYKNNVGSCYRCSEVVQPFVSKQWFVRMDRLAQPAIDAVKSGEIKFVPKRFEKMFFHWMENTRDWCVSRQLWWGHRIPVFYCDTCGYQFAAAKDQHTCPKCGAALRQDEDVLDTWFSSALWPFSTLGWPTKSADLDYFYPSDLLVTGYDIIGFWVSRMIFSGLAHMKQKPFGKVLIHGIVRDKDGKKMSKSSGNGVDPLEVIDNLGADVLRISVVNGVSMGGDMKYMSEKLEGYRNFMNKIWNASRFVLINCDNITLLDLAKAKANLTLADKWIMSRLNSVIAQVKQLMEKFEIGLAATEIYEFVWNEFCDWYIEMSKLSLYSDDLASRNLTLNVLLYVLREVLKLAHPIIPFITAEIYNQLPNKDADDIMIASYPTAKKSLYKDEAESTEMLMRCIKSIRNLRREMNVSQSRQTLLMIIPAKGMHEKVLESAKYIKKLGFASDCQIIDQKPATKCAVMATELGEMFIPLGQLVDAAAEIARLDKELEKISSELERAEGKLKNQGFMAKAPAELVQAEKQKIQKFQDEKELIQAAIKKFKDI